MKGVQCYELFGGIALKNHTFSFFHFHIVIMTIVIFNNITIITTTIKSLLVLKLIE